MLWADDLILTADSVEGIQSQLNGLLKFCSKYQMIVNTLRTNMFFGKKEKQLPEYTSNNYKVEICDMYKYIVLFSCTNTVSGNMFKDMSNYVCDKACTASFAAMSKCRGIGKIIPKIGY